jgi:hypothetical protein
MHGVALDPFNDVSHDAIYMKEQDRQETARDRKKMKDMKEKRETKERKNKADKEVYRCVQKMPFSK